MDKSKSIFKKRNRLILRLFLIVLVLDGLFYRLTSPNSLNPLIIIMGLIMISLTAFIISLVVMFALPKFGFFIDKPYKISFIIAITLLFVTALQTIGQLTFRDIFVVVILGITLYVYLEKFRPKKRIK